MSYSLQRQFSETLGLRLGAAAQVSQPQERAEDLAHQAVPVVQIATNQRHQSVPEANWRAEQGDLGVFQPQVAEAEQGDLGVFQPSG